KLNYSDFERLNKPNFIGRRWSWVDPLKDVQASALAIDKLLSTHTDEAAKQGKDFNQIIQTQIKETKLIIELNKLRREAGMIKNSEPINTPDEDEPAGENQKQLLRIA